MFKRDVRQKGKRYAEKGEKIDLKDADEEEGGEGGRCRR